MFTFQCVTFVHYGLHILQKITFKAGIIEEMLEDTMEGLGDEEELEEEVQVISRRSFWMTSQIYFVMQSYDYSLTRVRLTKSLPS